MHKLEDSLNKILKTYIKYSTEDIDLNHIINVGEIVNISKNTILKNYNSLENYMRLILKGIGGYFINIKDIEKCIYFNFENEFFFDYISFFHRQKTEITLKTMTPSQMFIIKKEKYDELCKQYPQLLYFQENGLKILYEDTLKKYIELLTLDARERYKLLIKNRQDIIRQIDNKYIASYLGIAPQSLSRLKRGL